MTTPNFQCTFAGYNLISPTAELRTWLNHNMDLSDMKFTVDARNWPGALTDVTYPLNDRQKDKLELYKLIYPESKVSNWGEVLVLINGNDLAGILSTAGTGGQDLVFQSGPDNTLTFSNMQLLAVLPVCQLDDSIESGRTESVITHKPVSLYLGLIVDERYYIANYSAASVEPVGCGSTWTDLITGLLSDCDVDADVPDIDDGYGVPCAYSDLIELGECNAAMMLDAALLNCGLQIVRSPDGTYNIYDYDDATSIEDNETHEAYQLRGGGDWYTNASGDFWLSTMPDDCIFYFPVWDTYSSSDDCNYEITVDDSTTVSFSDDCCCGLYPPPTDSWLNQYSDEDQNAYDASYYNIFHLRSPLNAVSYYSYTVTKSTAFALTSITEPAGYSSGDKIFRMTARAQGSSPTNVDQLADLSQNLAADFYTRKYWSLMNEVWNQMVPPSGSGWFTYIYIFSDLDCVTKIVGDFANHDVEQFMHDVCQSSSESSWSSSESSWSSSESSWSSSGSSESSGCDQSWFNDLPLIVGMPQYVLGIDANGCPGLIPTTNCSDSSSSSSEEE